LRPIVFLILAEPEGITHLICTFAHSLFFMFSANVNKKIFEITPQAEGFLVNGETVLWDRVEITQGYFHILLNAKSYKAEIVKADHSTKSFQIKINGRIYPVEVKDKFDLLLEKMGMNNSSGNKVNTIKAPMPGLIIDLKVKNGDTVKSGDPLLILEAMKMENIIKAPGEGVVKTVKIKKGDSVEKNQVLIEF
jgi:biotin carboxyl carrier protein